MTPTGGTFDLSLLAQPHTNPTQLVSFSINNADPNDPSPTSISLSFSGPINVNSVINLTSPDLQETGLQVVDSSGKEWPITTLEYEATSAQLTMVFNEPLPAGQYRLIVPSRGGLTDLAGLPVSAPDEPAGVLASWSVAVTSNGPKGPTDLGVLWPAVGGNLSASASSEFVENTSLTPDQPVSYRWVVTVPGMYALQTQSGGSDIEIVNVGNGKTDLIDAGSTGSLNTYLMANLSTGTYELTFLQQGQSASLVRWTLKCAFQDWDAVLVNGVNASSALSLMTFSPTLQGSGTGSSSGLMSVNPTPSGGSISPTLTGSPFGDSMAPLSASLFVTVNTGLMGQPFGNSQAFASSDASALGSSTALAGGPSGESPLSGNNSLLLTSATADDVSQTAILGQGQAGAAPVEVVVTQPTTRVPEVNTSDASALADARAVALAESLGQIGSLIQNWIAPSQPESPQAGLATTSMAAHPITTSENSGTVDDKNALTRNRRVLATLRPDFGAAAGLITLGAVAHGMRRPIQKWWRQCSQIVASPLNQPMSRLPYHASPHRISRVTTRVRRPLQPR